jgi:hypothetical protein
MRRVGIAFLFVALVAVAGCKGDKGDPGAQGPIGATGATGVSGVTGATGATGTFDGSISLSSVVPDQVFVGRTHWITIAGFNTNWTNDPEANYAVTFCDGVTVDKANIILASPSALVVPITVDADATLGSCTVTVTTDGTPLVYADGFSLASPLAVTSYSGDVAQGSWFVLYLQNLDFENPWDGSKDADGQFAYLAFHDIAGLSLFNATVEPFAMTLVYGSDVLATTGARGIVFDSGVTGAEMTFALPEAFAIAARTPVALVANTPQTAHLDTAWSTKLYVYTPPSGDSHATFTVAPVDTTLGASPYMNVLTADGKWATQIAYSQNFHWWTTAGSPLYFVVEEGSYAEDYDFTLKASIDQESTNNTCATAMALTAPTRVTGQSLADLEDVDWYKITTGSGDAGKLIQIQTLEGDLSTHAHIDIFEGACPGAEDEPWASSQPWMSLEGMLTDKTVAASTTYFIKISYAGTKFEGSFYDLQVKLLGPEPTTGNDCSSAVTLTLPYSSSTPFLLTAPTDEDWFMFVTGSADENRLMAIETLPGDRLTDTAISLYTLAVNGDCTTDLVPIVEDFDGGFLASFSLFAEPSTAYYLKITRVDFPNAGDALYNLKVTIYPPAETEPNDTCATAEAVTLPYEPTGVASLTDDSDQDWFKFTATAADVGKRVHVTALPADYVDTKVEILHGTTCGTLNTLGAGSYYPEAYGLIYEAGTYYVKVSAGTYGTQDGNFYTISIAFE